MLLILDKRLAWPVHRMLPTDQTPEIVAHLRPPRPQRVPTASGPDNALNVRRLQLAVNAQDATVLVDMKLRVEKCVSVLHAFGDAKGDGD